MDKATKEADHVLDIASKKLSFMYVNPTNSTVEKYKVYTKPDYNPQFRYRKLKFSLELLRRKIKKLKINDPVYGKLLNILRDHNLDKVKMLESIGTPSFTKNALNVYGKPGKKLIDKAYDLIELPVKSSRKDVPSSVYNYILKEELDAYGLDEWKVKMLKGLSSSAFVNIADKTILLKRGEKHSQHFIKVLMVHEIGTHVLRAENGALQPLKIFRTGFPFYLSTEEGLAVYNESKVGLLNNKILKNYAGRVLAVHMSLDKPFSEVFQYLRKYFPKSTAYTLALRAKRGLGDTSQPGGCTKDFVYLKGYYDVLRYIEKGGDYNKLYYGKVAIEYLPLLDNMELVEPKYFPKLD